MGRRVARDGAAHLGGLVRNRGDVLHAHGVVQRHEFVVGQRAVFLITVQQHVDTVVHFLFTERRPDAEVGDGVGDVFEVASVTGEFQIEDRRQVLPGDYKAIANSLDYPCSTGLSPQVIAAAAAVLRNDPHFLQCLRLRIADVGTNEYNLISYKNIRDGLQAIARTKP